MFLQESKADRLQEIDFQDAGKRDLYQICVKIDYFEYIKDRGDTKWRGFLTVPAELSPSWRLFYKGPLPKRSGDLQWRLLHCALPTNSHISKFNLNVRLAAEGRNINLLKLFTTLVESRIRVEHRFFQITNNLLEFEFKWCANRALLSLCEDGEIMFNW